MNYLYNYEKAWDSEVSDWLFKSIPELTPYQREKIRDKEIVRFAPFEFYKRRKKVNNPLLRITIIFFPIVILLLIVSLPVMFMFTGRWGYSTKRLDWFSKWKHSLQL